MAEKKATCAICGRRVPRDAEFFPFCGERCKMVDLGRWMSGSYRISRQLEPRDVDSFDPEGFGSPGQGSDSE
jgi:hypothetical protein